MKLAILVSLTLAAACGGKSGSGSDKPYDLDAECDAYTQALHQLAQCPKLSEDEVRVVNAELLIGLDDHATALEDASVAPATAERCHQGRAEVRDRTASSGC